MKFTNSKLAVIMVSLILVLAAFTGMALADDSLDMIEDDIAIEETFEESEFVEDSLDSDIIDDTESAELIDADETIESDARTYRNISLNVAYRSQSDIVNFVQKNAASTQDEISYNAEQSMTAPYSLGQISDTTAERALNLLNQFRYIAGLDADVELNSKYTTLAQAASVVNYANNTLSHTPSRPSGMGASIYAQGKSGASKSNLAYDYSLNNALLSYMNDSDSSNIAELGHRRWMLNPKMGKTGFGATGAYSAMYATDKTSSSSASGVAWPAQEMPIEYFSNDIAWSFSTGSKVTASTVNVTLTRSSDNRVWNFSNNSADGYFNVSNDSYGQVGCIIFRPEDIEINSGDSFNVDITVGSIAYNYTVNFFSIGSTDAVSDDENVTEQNEEENEPVTPIKYIASASLTSKDSSVTIVNVDGDKVIRVNANTTVAQLKAALEGEVAISASSIATGVKVMLTVNGIELDSAKIAVIGDATKDGKVNASDYAQITKASRVSFTGASEIKSAMDMNGDGSINADDVAVIKSIVFGR